MEGVVINIEERSEEIEERVVMEIGNRGRSSDKYRGKK